MPLLLVRLLLPRPLQLLLLLAGQQQDQGHRPVALNSCRCMFLKRTGWCSCVSAGALVQQQ
jgi:hypothetical protein